MAEVEELFVVLYLLGGSSPYIGHDRDRAMWWAERDGYDVLSMPTAVVHRAAKRPLPVAAYPVTGDSGSADAD